jgi:ParB/RepB/Spo0J family partition protein
MYDYPIKGYNHEIPLLDIYADTRFNCRGEFVPAEVFELGQQIKTEGQLVPVIVQPMNDVLVRERPEPCAWPLRLVAGYRRYMAIERWVPGNTILAEIKEGLSPQQARALNYTENLHREDLNMLQEADGLFRSWPDDEVKDIARLVGKPKRWVAARLDLLRLPDYVQRHASTGQLSQYDVEQLAKLHTDQVQAAFQRIVTTKGKRGRAPAIKGSQPWRLRPRGKQEIGKAVGLLLRYHQFSKLSDEAKDYIISTLIWVTKEIGSKEFLENRLGFPEGCVRVDKDDKLEGLKEED